MKQLTDARELEVGDVVMVSQKCKDKATGKPYVRRYFAVIQQRGVYFARGVRLDAPVPDRPSININFYTVNMTVHKLDEDEWPDGVWALRTRLIMEGAIDII